MAVLVIFALVSASLTDFAPAPGAVVAKAAGEWVIRDVTAAATAVDGQSLEVADDGVPHIAYVSGGRV